MEARKPFGKSLRNLPFVRTVRSGLIMLVPVLTVGSIALILRSFPIAAYQTFITTACDGFFYDIFSFIYNATFGMLSLYIAAFLGYCTINQREENDMTLGAVSSAITAFLISIGFLTSSFDTSSFSAVGMFTAIICGTAAPTIYIFLKRKMRAPKIFSDGSEPMFNRAIGTICPLALVCLLFALINFLISVIFKVNNIWQLFADFVNALFSAVGLNFFGGFLYILLSSLMWFFGIHGSDVLESVTAHLFEPAMAANIAAVAAGSTPTEIFTKTFFDVFVLMGGCGSALALLAALLIFGKRRSNRSIAKIAAFPMLFNINELMVFGLPIVYNPTLFIPFIAAPLSCFLISTVAMYSGLVPLTTKAVEWTTPIILGGYQSTGSVAGALLQLVNLAVATLIYMPFVRRYDKVKEAESRANIDLLVRIFKKNETENKAEKLTEEKGIVGGIAKQLVNDLRSALDKKEIFMLYQPQNNSEGKCVGAEALLRWKHESFGFVYPPLVVKLAGEGGFLTELEKYVFLKVKADMEKSGFALGVSVNVTVSTLQSEGFVEFLAENFPKAKAGNAPVCVEITEQTELVNNVAMTEKLSDLRAHGFLLAIDDFSMGFTSLKYLQECRFDEVKLDGSLVRGLTAAGNAREIISSIVYLSSSLGFKVLAEFVETAEQKNMLLDIGCKEYQGYYYSRPISVEELSDYCEK